jgi:nicotinate-nucleotide pyrophosphorylase (carboxylating)
MSTSFKNISYQALLEKHIKTHVAFSLDEDIGSGDVTAQLIDADKTAKARVLTREPAILCGQAWVEETFKQLDPELELTWLAEEGDELVPDQVFLELSGKARSILTGERCALNYLQTLMGTATTSFNYNKLVKAQGVSTSILDTRKTIPGLRLAQKYAVLVGGCDNHRIALYDMFLIKENHIAACGGIDKAIKKARQINPDIPVEVEVETLQQLEAATNAGADIIMLDNFDLDNLPKESNIPLEVSGNLDMQKLAKLPSISRASVGLLTKALVPIDLSLRLVD